MQIDEIIKLAKCFTNDSRLKLIRILAEREFCVCELEEITGQSQSNISQHLRNLYNVGLVKKKRDGQLIYYWLDQERYRSWVEQLSTFIALPLAEINEFEEMKENLDQLDQNERVKECKNC